MLSYSVFPGRITSGFGTVVSFVELDLAELGPPPGSTPLAGWWAGWENPLFFWLVLALYVEELHFGCHD